ncbi:MAG: O-antigen ligase family protein, partial [Pseudomonadota bacterium]
MGRSTVKRKPAGRGTPAESRGADAADAPLPTPREKAPIAAAGSSFDQANSASRAALAAPIDTPSAPKPGGPATIAPGRVGVAALQASFWLFLFLLAWSPLPLASNRPWSWSLLTLLTGAALALWALSFMLRGVSAAAPLKGARFPIAAMTLVALWAVIQWAPMPIPALQHPIWGAAANAGELAVSGRITVSPYATSTAISHLATYCSAFWLAFQFAQDRRRARLMLKATALIGLAYAGYGLFTEFSGSQKILFLDKTAYLDSLTSTFINRNSYATYAAFGLIASVGVLIAGFRAAARERRGWRGRAARLIEAGSGRLAVFAIAAAGCASALLLTDSRAGVASAAVGLATLLGLMFAPNRSQRLASLAVFGGAAILGAGLLALSGGDTLSRADATAEDFSTRLAVYQTVWQMIRDAPLLGVGYGAFADAFPAYRDGYAGYLFIFDKAHNTYLQAIVELGWPASLLLF